MDELFQKTILGISWNGKAKRYILYLLSFCHITDEARESIFGKRNYDDNFGKQQLNKRSHTFLFVPGNDRKNERMYDFVE